MCDIKLKY